LNIVSTEGRAPVGYNPKDISLQIIKKLFPKDQKAITGCSDIINQLKPVPTK